MLERVYVLTRTSGRPNAFHRCRMSLLGQDYLGEIVHVVSTDMKEDGEYVDGDLVVDVSKVRSQGRRMENAYIGAMLKVLPDEEGWVIVLDDDDQFSRSDSVTSVMGSVWNDDQMAIWRVLLRAGKKGPRKKSRVVPPMGLMGKPPVVGQIASPGVAYPLKWKALGRFEAQRAGDYPAIKRLYDALNPVWIDDVLTETQGGAGMGRREDLPPELSDD